MLAWEDAAELGGEKWSRAFAASEAVRVEFARLLEDPQGLYALGANTHELLLRFLSILPWQRRRCLVTTDGEFHTIRRQLSRLEEEGVEIRRIPSDPSAEVASLLRQAIDDRVAAVLVSSVFFRSGEIVDGLSEVLAACQEHGAELLVDTYHSVNALPFSIPRLGLEDAFIVGGGYKYCQLGEGNCFLRIPDGRTFRPVVTGWFSEFSALERAEQTREGGVITYGQGVDAFAGSTYDPTSHYRAREVFGFFRRQGLTPERLRQVSQHQVGLLRREFDALDLPPALIRRPPDLPLDRVAGFLALLSPRAGELCDELRRRGVLTDHRDGILRFGPAPYLSDRQLRDSMGWLGESVRSLESAPSRSSE
jgi:kynureninase